MKQIGQLWFDGGVACADGGQRSCTREIQRSSEIVPLPRGKIVIGNGIAQGAVCGATANGSCVPDEGAIVQRTRIGSPAIAAGGISSQSTIAQSAGISATTVGCQIADHRAAACRARTHPTACVAGRIPKNQASIQERLKCCS